MYYVYILKCSDQTFYTGITSNLTYRLEKHLGGEGALYTKARLPVKLVYFETFDTCKNAREREIVVKDLNQLKKRKLIENFSQEKLMKFTSG